MRRFKLLMPLAVVLAITGFGASGISAQEAATPVAVNDTLVLVERDENTETIDIGEPGPSAGDILVWGPNPLYDAENESDTGATLAGQCIWLDSDGHQHCSMTFVFPDGSMVTAQGPQQEGGVSTMVITGGTGQYLGATGRLQSEPSSDNSTFTQTLEFER